MARFASTSVAQRFVDELDAGRLRPSSVAKRLVLGGAAELVRSDPGLVTAPDDGSQLQTATLQEWQIENVSVDEASETILPSLELALVSLGSFLVVYLLGRFLLVPSIRRAITVRNRRNPTVVEAVERFSTLVVLLVGVALAIAVAGFGHLLSGSALVIAAGTLAVGVAGQAVIGNLVSGLFLVADPEFNVDDWIAWEDNAGVVETIKFRVTRVRTANGEVITVPNTTLATTAISRPYSRERHRIVVRVGIAHEENAQRAMAGIRDVVDGVDGVLEEPEPTVVVDDIGDDALWLRSLFWIADPSRGDVRDARSEFVRALQERLKADDVAFSPPSEHDLSGEIAVDGPER